MIICGDAQEKLKELPSESVNCCVTSPPYLWLRDYGIDGQIGLEDTPQEYIDKLVSVFRDVRRVLKDDGTLWLNIGDSWNAAGRGSLEFSERAAKQATNSGSITATTGKTLFKGCKPKDMIGIPWMLAFALREDGWYLRQDIIWHKPNPMPESVTDRCTKSHEYIFLLSKSKTYYFNNDAIAEPTVTYDYSVRDRDNTRLNNVAGRTRMQGLVTNQYEKRNKRDVWSVTTKPFRGAHFAVFPEDLIEPCILAGCPKGGVVLDPFFGSGTTGRVATRLGRDYIGIELNPEYIKICEERTGNVQMELDLFG